MNDGGPAFPIPNDDRPGAYEAHPGMSLRDYFAGQALIGFLAGLCTTTNPADLDADLIARCCRIQADAMLKAREES